MKSQVLGPTPTRSETITLARAHLRFADYTGQDTIGSLAVVLSTVGKMVEPKIHRV
jgi:hypothetical protein